MSQKVRCGRKSHGVEAAHVIAIDAAHYAAGDQGEDKAVGEDHCAGAQGGENAMLDLVEEIGGVHEREGESSDSVFGEELVNVAADKIRTAQAAGLHSEAFGLEPLLEQGDLRGAAGAVHAFDDHEGAGDFGGIETDERLAEEIVGGFFFDL